MGFSLMRRASVHFENFMVGYFLIVVDRSSRVLAQLRNSRSRPGLGLPGGGYDRRDRTGRRCAIRELLEEANVKADPSHVHHLGGYYYWVKAEHCTFKTGKSSHSGETRPISEMKKLVKCEEAPCWQHAWVTRAEIERTRGRWVFNNAARAIAASRKR